MMENQIKISNNGPLQVSGDFQIFDSEGKEYPKKAKVYLCRCGLSNKKPFCDGSHKKGGFESSPRATE
ncbi:CDGSH iron-sulfur domain-containing protein [Bacillus sp. UNC41MFS5]|uniref:CDGSH iron-sulfur domain-containing protein n=1 Tax=Bacillus sp. UNC41MFS5 TaxID=1449046 RepID=UPI0004794631|nr:CDGSH iron-sulfur domain-containing protein [Bacillus sp. UNC41MFS5]